MQVGRCIYFCREVAIMSLLTLQYWILASDKLSHAFGLLQFLHPGVSNLLISNCVHGSVQIELVRGFSSKFKLPARCSTRTNCCMSRYVLITKEF